MVCKTHPDLFCTGCIVSLHEDQVCLLAWKEGFHFRKAHSKQKHPPLGLESLEMLLVTVTGLFFHQ